MLTPIRLAAPLAWALGVATLACSGAPSPEAASPAHAQTPSLRNAARASRTETTAGLPSGDAAGPSSNPREALDKAYRAGRDARGGKNADYIPSLAKVNPELFGVALVTVRGEILTVGDAKHPFAIESVSKVFTLARVLEESGPDAVAKFVGTNATGMPFNSIVAMEINKEHRADNPFVNPGAIATVSLVSANGAADRWNKILGTMSAFAGRPLPLNEEVYRSESETNSRNRAIAWLLKSYDTLRGDPDEMLDVYTRQCSVAVTAAELATMGSVLANGGVHPITHQRLLSRDNAARVLSVMSTNGLYDGSGAWSYRVGIPAKSGVGGGIVGVVPGRYAIAAFSPPLDAAGNSVRAQKAIEAFVLETGGGVYTSTPLRTAAR